MGYTAPPMTTVSSHPWRAGLRAARANLGPGAILWIVGVAVVVGYYHWPAMHRTLEQVARIKQHYGIGFSMVSTALFGGMIPTLVQQLRPRWRHVAPIRHLPYLVLFFLCSGAVVDRFYWAQALLFGDDNQWLTVAIKMAVDQFVVTPIWFVPYMVIGFQFKNSGYSIRRTRRDLGRGWYLRRGVPLMVANWGVWIPAVICIYCLPLPLQLPIQNLVLCLWSLMLLLLTNHEPTAIG